MSPSFQSPFENFKRSEKPFQGAKGHLKELPSFLMPLPGDEALRLKLQRIERRSGRGPHFLFQKSTLKSACNQNLLSRAKTQKFNTARDNIILSNIRHFLRSSEMPLLNTSLHSSGEILTGKLWRNDHQFFNGLPFYSNIPRMDEIAGPLQKALCEVNREGCYVSLLVVRSDFLFCIFYFNTSDRNSERD